VIRRAIKAGAMYEVARGARQPFDRRNKINPINSR
jgi:hypothetical protein